MTRLWTRTVATVGIAALLVAGLAASTLAADKLTIRLSWKIKGEFAPLFVAVDRGYYKEQGLDVQVLEGAGAATALKLIANGNDAFGYLGAVEAAQAVSEGLPVKMVANYIKKMPISLVSWPELPLRHPKDLEGKTIAVTPGDSFLRILPAFAKTHGVDQSKIKLASMDPSGRITMFLQKKADILSTYLTNDLPVAEDKAGVKFNTFHIYDWGFNLVGHGLVTSHDFIKKNPDVVQKVVAATSKAMVFTQERPDDAAKSIVKYFPKFLNERVTAVQVRITNTLMTSPKTAGKPVGWNSPEEWSGMLELLHSTGTIKTRKPDDAYYTNEFVK